MTPLEAFEYITTLSVDKNGKLHIDNIEKCLMCCQIVQDELEHNDLTVHSLEQKVHTIDRDLGFLLEHIEVEEIKDIGMIEPDYRMTMSFPPFNYRQNCMRVRSMQCQWRERNK